MTDEGKEMCKLIFVIIVILIVFIGLAHLCKRVIPKKETYREPIIVNYVKEVNYDT